MRDLRPVRRHNFPERFHLQLLIPVNEQTQTFVVRKDAVRGDVALNRIPIGDERHVCGKIFFERLRLRMDVHFLGTFQKFEEDLRPEADRERQPNCPPE